MVILKLSKPPRTKARASLPVLLLIGALSAFPAHAAETSPTQLSHVFCAGRLAGDMTSIVDWLTIDLSKALDKAKAKDDAFTAAHPGTKSPLADGPPWQGDPVQVRDCQFVGMTGTSDEPQAVLSYKVDPPGHDFSDRLVLNFIDGDLRIDNIQYGKGGDLRSALKAASANK